MMKKVKLLILFLIITSVNYSQIKETENIKTGKTTNKITLSESGMYEGTKSEKAEEYFEKANTSVDEGNLNDAVKYYKKAIKEDTGFVEAYDNLALAYRKMKKFDKAIQYYKKSIEMYPNGHMAHLNLASAYSLKKNFDKAYKEYNNFIKIFPDDPEGFYGLANIYFSTKKYDDALKNAKKALDMYIKSGSDLTGDAYYLIGLIYYYKNDRDNAKQNFSAAKKLGIKMLPQIENEFFTINQDDITLNNNEDYINSEETFVKNYNWLLKESIGTDLKKRQAYNRFVFKWVSGCPYINISINEKIVQYPKCGNCLIIFMGGWANYAIQKKDFNNAFQGALKGTENVIQFYLSNKEVLGKNKGIEKLIKMKNNHTLEEYIKSNI